MATKNGKPRFAFVAIALILMLAGIGPTISPPPQQAGDSASAWDVVPHLAATVLPNVAFADEEEEEEEEERSLLRRLWEALKGFVERTMERVVEWIVDHCEGGGTDMFGGKCTIPFPGP